MMITTKTLKSILLLLLLTSFYTNSNAQNSTGIAQKPSIFDQPDPRIDNMGYWMMMADKGLVSRNPHISVPPAIFKGSAIKSNGIKTTSSPDIPVSNQANVTESENSVFIDPDNVANILNSNNSTGWDGTTSGTIYGANHFLSTTAGNSWTGSVQGAGGGSNWGDPTTAIGLNGRHYVNFISSTSGQGISFSDDKTNWTKTIVAPNPGDIADKNHMWIDNKNTSPFQGNLYVGWTDYGGPDDGQIRLTRSTSNGATWSTPLSISQAINAGSHNQGVNLQTGPNGEVYAIWAVYDSYPSDETAIGFARSTDGGVSFQPATRIITNIRGIRNSGVSKNHRVNSFPVMAVDISNGPDQGNIYIVWTNIGTPGTNTGTNRSVWLIRSINGGSTWSSPVRVNQGPFVPGKAAYFPWISCDPETGVLSAVFYDDRNTTSTQCETFVAWSDDAGNTWDDFPVSDVAFTPSPIPDLATGYMGDYLGITSKGGKVYPCWTDTRGGRFMTYVSPLEIGLNARFAATTTVNCTDQEVTFTNLSTGDPTTWTWNFPGGTPSVFVGENPPSITYTNHGIFDVSLTITNDSASDTELKTGYIIVKEAVAGFSANPATIAAGNFVTFTDLSFCNPLSWQWTFPGGTPSTFTGQNPPPITYAVAGTYDVILAVTNAIGSDTLFKQSYIMVNPAVFNMTNGVVNTCFGNFYDSGGPSANYKDSENYTETFYPTTPSAMVKATFSSFMTELNRDTLTIYNGTSSAAPVLGKYHGTTSPGTVMANNPSGALTFRFRSDGSITKPGWNAAISCYTSNLPPVADFSASITSCALAQTVSFTDLSANYPFSWAWTFSSANVSFVNGTSAASRNPEVQFTAAGTYSVTLTATNAFGSDTITKTGYITVISCTINAFPWIENFENQSTIPFCWTQAQVNGSGINWSVLKGNGNLNPASAHSGIRNVCLKDNSSADNKTKLITPTLNLNWLSNPQLKFWHTQAAWYGDQDYLSVYYRTTPTGSWILLATYTSSYPAWTQETLSLPGASNAYSIAFEGNAKWGHGVCIDDVEVTGVNTVPVTRALQNISVTGINCFDAIETISVAGNGSYFSVPAGGGATLIAGQKILVYPGFNVAHGGYFHGYIAQDGPFCPSPMNKPTTAGVEKQIPAEMTFQVKLFPNPTTGNFFVQPEGISKEETLAVDVYNMQGKRLFSRQITRDYPPEFSLEDHAQGIYLVRISNGQRSETVRVVKSDL
jgi:PKD repeat protein